MLFFWVRWYSFPNPIHRDDGRYRPGLAAGACRWPTCIDCQSSSLQVSDVPILQRHELKCRARVIAEQAASCRALASSGASHLAAAFMVGGHHAIICDAHDEF